MNEINFRILKEKGLLIVPDFPEGGIEITKDDQTLRAALKIELARNFGFWLKNDFGVTPEFVIDFFGWLKDRGELKTQPYFPNLLPINQEGVDIGSLSTRIKKSVTVITRSNYLETVMTNRSPDSLELLWLKVNTSIYNYSTRILAEFLSKYIKGGRIKAGRKERREFMDSLERTGVNYHYGITMTDLWKKVALWIHPSDYPEYPVAQKFLFSVLNSEKKKEPEKPRLKKLMWKGWEEGKDFDVFESYIDQKGLTPRELLISLRDYERCPRVSRWKKTEGVELGKEKVGEEETEVVDLMLLQLKDKLLGMMKPKRANFKIPHSFYKIPAHSILKHSLIDPGGALPEEVKSFRITAPEKVGIITYNLDGIDSCDREWDHLENCLDFFIVGYQMGGWRRTKLSITLAGKKGETLGRSEIDVNEDVNSLILFGYEASTHTLKWIGEPSKTFYAGKPSGITDWKNVWKVCMERKPILSLGELAEKMYNNVENSSENLTAERIRIDLGI